MTAMETDIRAARWTHTTKEGLCLTILCVSYFELLQSWFLFYKKWKTNFAFGLVMGHVHNKYLQQTLMSNKIIMIVVSNYPCYKRLTHLHSDHSYEHSSHYVYIHLKTTRHQYSTSCRARLVLSLRRSTDVYTDRTFYIYNTYLWVMVLRGQINSTILLL